jgi:hypothetical protein
MTYTGNRRFQPSLPAILALITSAFANPALAYPITYDIGPGSAPGFSGSWLHAGSVEMGSSGFYANGDKIRIGGQLTIDLATNDASGQLTGNGDFGLGDSDWSLRITGVSSAGVTFTGGETDLLSLDYVLESAAGYDEGGVFYFAARDFNGGAADDGPNYIDDSRLLLWGNNWLNTTGSSDRADFIAAGGDPLGLDLYGVAVPEPPVGLLLLGGLIGMGLLRRHS